MLTPKLVWTILVVSAAFAMQNEWPNLYGVVFPSVSVFRHVAVDDSLFFLKRASRHMNNVSFLQIWQNLSDLESTIILDAHFGWRGVLVTDNKAGFVQNLHLRPFSYHVFASVCESTRQHPNSHQYCTTLKPILMDIFANRTCFLEFWVFSFLDLNLLDSFPWTECSVGTILVDSRHATESFEIFLSRISLVTGFQRSECSSSWTCFSQPMNIRNAEALVSREHSGSYHWLTAQLTYHGWPRMSRVECVRCIMHVCLLRVGNVRLNYGIMI